MATMELEGQEVVIELARNERWLGLLPNLRIPLSSIESVDTVPDGRRAVHGVRAPGLGGPYRLIGTWRARGDKQYVCVRRGQPAVRIVVAGQRYRTVLFGSDDATSLTLSVGRAAGH